MSSLNQLSLFLQYQPDAIINELLARAFPGIAEKLVVTDYFESEIEGVVSHSLVIGVEESILLPVPGFEQLQLGVIRDDEDEWPLIFVEITTEGAPVGLLMQHFPLRIVIDNPYLIPEREGEDDNFLPGFSFEIEGSFGINAELDWQASVERFSLPMFRIAGIDMVLALVDCHIIADDDTATDLVSALGFDQQFRGIFAEFATLRWEVPVQIAGESLPGLHLDISDLALGNRGISCDAEFSWQVTHDGTSIDIAQTDLVGQMLIADWLLAVETVQLSVMANVPVGTGCSGVVQIPLFEQIFNVEMGYRYVTAEDYELSMEIAQASDSLTIAFGQSGYSATLSELQCSASLNEEQLNLSGSGQLNSLNLPGLSINAQQLGFEYRHESNEDQLSLTISALELDGWGEIKDAKLTFSLIEEDGQRSLNHLLLQAQIKWQELSSHFDTDSISGLLPLPPDSADVTLKVVWQGDSYQLQVAADIDASNVLLSFIPSDWQPTMTKAELSVTLQRTTLGYEGELSVDCALVLPDLQAFLPSDYANLVTVTTGNDDGEVHLSFEISAQHSAEDGDEAKLSASITEPVALSLQMPGMNNAVAPLKIVVTDIAMDMSANDSAQGSVTLKGDFTLNAISIMPAAGSAPPFMANLLDRLLMLSGGGQLIGSAVFKLGFNGEEPWVYFEGMFEQAALHLDVFDLLSRVAGAGNGSDGDASEIDLGLVVDATLAKIYLQWGSESTESDEPDFKFGMEGTFSVGPAHAELAFELSEDELSIALAQLDIPLYIPQLPFHTDDLTQLQNAAGRWDYQQQWLDSLAVSLNQDIADKSAELADKRAQLDNDDSLSEEQRFALMFREIPTLQKQLLALLARQFIYTVIMALYHEIELRASTGAESTFQNAVEVYQGMVDAALGWLHVDTDLILRLSDVRFVLPFHDPASLSLEGGASFEGISPDTPFSVLNGIQLRLGLSADAVYFVFEGNGQAIELPDFGRYPGTKVRLDKLLIGYGYTKNSLKVDVAGGLEFSPQLIEDADTSDITGVGIRLPTTSDLAFKLDLIPISLGEVNFLLPLPAFDIRLADSAALQMAGLNSSGEPYWDGLQLIVTDFLRIGLKQIKMTPFLGPIPAPNLTQSIDMKIGSGANKIVHSCQAYQVFLPVTGAPIPFVSDGTPFFDRYVSVIQFDQWGISLDLARPFPRVSPVFIYELIAFLSDPSMPVDENSELANVMYIQVHDAQISVPPAVAQMFPAAQQLFNQSYSFRLNVAHLVALVSTITEHILTVKERVSDTVFARLEWLASFLHAPLEVKLTKLLALLPHELTALQLQGKLVVFDANVQLYLGGINQLIQEEDAEPEMTRIYHTDFNRFERSMWVQSDYGLKQGTGNWQHSSLVGLIQDSNVGDNSPARYGSMLLLDNELPADMRVDAALSAGDNDGMGVIFHYQSKDTFYRFRMTEEQQEWSLVAIKKGDVSVLHHTAQRYQRGEDYTISVETRRVNNAITLSSSVELPERENINRLPSVGRPVIQDGLEIIIRVNNRQWCKVVDTQRPLFKGLSGLDSWWNNALTVSEFSIWAISSEASVQDSSELPNPGQVYERLTTPDTLPEFSEFDSQAWEALLSQAPQLAALMMARVAVWDNQLEMAGYLDGNGRFALLAKQSVNIMSLSALDISIPVKLEIAGACLINGQQNGADSWVNLSSSVYFDWIAIPNVTGDPAMAVLRITLGSEDNPAQLIVKNSHSYTVMGEGAIKMLHERIIVSGSMAMSPVGVQVSGDFNAVLFPANPDILRLSGQAEAKALSGGVISASGSGELAFLGMGLSSAEFRLLEQTLSFSASASFNSSVEWQGAVFDKVDMMVEGSADVKGQQCHLNGQIEATILGAQISGQLMAEHNGQNSQVMIAGALSWQGHQWLNGRILVSTEQVIIEGNLSAMLDISGALPDITGLPGLKVTLNVTGQFTFENGQLVACNGAVIVGAEARLPGMTNDQSWPILRRKVIITASFLSEQSDRKDIVQLFELDNLTLFDLTGLDISIPVVDTDNPLALYIHQNASFDVDGEGTEFTFLTPIKPSSFATPEFRFFINVYKETINIDLPEVQSPFPILSTQPAFTNQAPLIEIPIIDGEPVNLGKVELNNLNLSVSLAWENGQLGLYIGATDTFIPIAWQPFFTVPLPWVLINTRAPL